MKEERGLDELTDVVRSDATCEVRLNFFVFRDHFFINLNFSLSAFQTRRMKED